VTDFDATYLDSLEFRPQDDPVFRMTQLLLVMAEIETDGETADRLVFVDFLASHPFLVVEHGTPEHQRLLMLGFEPRSLEYLSPSHLFATRRELIGHDLSLVLSYGLASTTTVSNQRRYACTEAGRSICDRMTSMYALAVRESARMVVKFVRKLSDRALMETSRAWISAERTGPIFLVPDELAIDVDGMGTS
jgi:hypothetical protein